MTNSTSFDNFPLWIPFIAIVVSLLGYILGAVILFGFGIIIAVLYLIYCVSMEMMVLFRSCKYCYYYNRVCGLGKGKIASLVTKKGDAKKFCEKTVTFWDLLPDFLVFIFPLVGGIILSILIFSWIRIGILIVFLVLSFGGTAVIRGSLACKYCKQRELGCPAEQFFNRKTSKKIG